MVREAPILDVDFCFLFVTSAVSLPSPSTVSTTIIPHSRSPLPSSLTLVLHSPHPSLSFSTPSIPHSRSPLPSSLTLVLHSPHPSLSFSTPLIPHSRSPLPPSLTLVLHSPHPSLSFYTPLIPHSRSPLPSSLTLVLHSPPTLSSRSLPISVSVFLFSFYSPLFVCNDSTVL